MIDFKEKKRRSIQEKKDILAQQDKLLELEEAKYFEIIKGGGEGLGEDTWGVTCL